MSTSPIFPNFLREIFFNFNTFLKPIPTANLHVFDTNNFMASCCVSITIIHDSERRTRAGGGAAISEPTRRPHSGPLAAGEDVGGPPCHRAVGALGARPGLRRRRAGPFGGWHGGRRKFPLADARPIAAVDATSARAARRGQRRRCHGSLVYSQAQYYVFGMVGGYPPCHAMKPTSRLRSTRGPAPSHEGAFHPSVAGGAVAAAVGRRGEGGVKPTRLSDGEVIVRRRRTLRKKEEIDGVAAPRSTRRR